MQLVVEAASGEATPAASAGKKRKLADSTACGAKPGKAHLPSPAKKATVQLAVGAKPAASAAKNCKLDAMASAIEAWRRSLAVA